MIQGKIWFHCAAVHDPISPIIIKTAAIGWEAKYRQIDLVIKGVFNGEELVQRMKGWITVEPQKIIDIVQKFGRLRVMHDTELVIETETLEDFTNLQKAIKDSFGDQVELELIHKA